jgi:hypothetical protein
MNGQLCGWKGEDQPTFARVDTWKLQNALEELSVRGCVRAEDDHVGSGDHGGGSLSSHHPFPLFFLAFSFGRNGCNRALIHEFGFEPY